MILRIWHGVTPALRSDDFYAYMMKTGVPWYRSQAGNRGVYVLRRTKEEIAEFLLLSLWDSTASIERFAGADIDQAVYNFSDEDYLQKLEPRVAHYEVLFGTGPPEPGPDATGHFSFIV